MPLLTVDVPVQPVEQRRSRLALTALLAGGVAIGGSPIFVRLSEIGPMATAFWRVGLALIPLFLLFRLTGGHRTPGPADTRDRLALMLPGLFLAIDLVAWHMAIGMTTVANATLLANLAPVFVTLVGWLLFRLPVTRLFLAGLAVALMGIVTLKGGLSGLAAGNLAGDGLAVLAALFYAGYMISVARLRDRFETLRVMLWSSAAAAVCLLPVVLVAEDQLIPATLFGWSMLAGLALVSHAGGQVAITFALAYLPTAFSSLTLLLQPVVAALLGVALLGEAVTLLQAAGGIIVLLGILIARRSGAVKANA